MGRIRVGTVLVAACAAAAVSATAQAAAGGRVETAVDRFVAHVDVIEQVQITTSAQAADQAARAAVVQCDQQVTARTELADAIRSHGLWVGKEVRAAQGGAATIGRLARLLGPRGSALRRAYVADLDAIDSELDLQLAAGGDILAGASAIEAGDCAAGAGTVTAAAQRIATERGAVDAALARLQSRF